ncbi:DUF4184 family protein [Chromatium okenii]|uniref:DUF4184 domain-containing protein n=1 Tax=Chromatium okenii TaxID=61644 RepID=A0A2S7XV82_9GAMM|nr:DUF4184 family protein [Chromatium okenii]PQJ97433.1 hypothetical protein CXB77_02085 [Chromatium okenii]
MPFTALHMGPGIAIKALAGQQFSVLTFGIAQIAMDIEPLLGMMRGAERLHGVTHTYLAAVGIAALVAMIAPLLGRSLLRRWNRELRFYHLDWLTAPETFTPVAVISGALLGTLSHVLLDSLMHADMTPFAPWSDANPLRGWLSITALHWFCVATGLLGISGWLAQKWRQRGTVDD